MRVDTPVFLLRSVSNSLKISYLNNYQQFMGSNYSCFERLQETGPTENAID